MDPPSFPLSFFFFLSFFLSTFGFAGFPDVSLTENKCFSPREVLFHGLGFGDHCKYLPFHLLKCFTQAV